MRHRLAPGLILAVLLLARLCHLDIVWVEEGYPSAAAIQMLYGKTLYRDIWFDKPPLSPYVYLLWGAHTGWPLRLAGIGFVLLCCGLAYGFAAQLWSEREGIYAALLLACYLTFGIPSAVMALAPDLLMIAPHIGAVWLAWRGRPLASGLVASIALLLNPKGLFLAPVCLLWVYRSWWVFLIGFVLPNAAALLWFGRPYWDEVWAWGAVYSRHGFPPLTGLTRTLNWIGFQSAIVAVAVVCLWKHPRSRMAAWVAVSFLAVCAGWRFFPRYYFQLLVPVVILAARGFVLLRPRCAIAVALLLLIPVIRFGPRYMTLASDLIHHRPHHWSDLQLSQDSEEIASKIPDRSGTLLVWGYRPDIYALTRMKAATPFLDSQPLTGVIADRHLVSSEVTYPDLAK
ncbi:MAG: hypothetical protein JO022_17250, partial [Acidobacteriaceae bacterium]|nr:hypothetical protein [Acidobacteriaceae bacterium]